MIITLKNIYFTDNSILTLILVIIVYTVSVISVIYGSRKHYVTEVIKNPSVFIFLFITLTEAVYYIFEKYFINILPPWSNVIIYINSGIFIIGVIVSLIDEKYYTNSFPITIYRIAAYVIGLSVVLIIIEIIYILFIIIGAIMLIIGAIWSAVDFETFKKNILFWRNRT